MQVLQLMIFWHKFLMWSNYFLDIFFKKPSLCSGLSLKVARCWLMVCLVLVLSGTLVTHRMRPTNTWKTNQKLVKIRLFPSFSSREAQWSGGVQKLNMYRTGFVWHVGHVFYAFFWSFPPNCSEQSGKGGN